MLHYRNHTLRVCNINRNLTINKCEPAFVTAYAAIKHMFFCSPRLCHPGNFWGHECNQVTEIYFHLTIKGFDQIKSPHDTLDR